MNNELNGYRNVCIEKGPEYYDYENYIPVWGYTLITESK